MVVVYRLIPNSHPSQKINSKFIYDSHPIPSLSPSNLLGSGLITLKFEYPVSPQSKSGGSSGIHTSGYDESQLFS